MLNLLVLKSTSKYPTPTAILAFRAMTSSRNRMLALKSWKNLVISLLTNCKNFTNWLIEKKMITKTRTKNKRSRKIKLVLLRHLHLKLLSKLLPWVPFLKRMKKKKISKRNLLLIEQWYKLLLRINATHLMIATFENVNAISSCDWYPFDFNYTSWL